jgi:hypothetical protein
MKVVGIVLILLGVIALAWGGITYTTRDKVVDLGPIEATKETKRTVPLPPLAGAASLVAGIALVAMDRRR